MTNENREVELKEIIQGIYAITLDPMNKTRSGSLTPANVGKIQKLCRKGLKREEYAKGV